MLELKVDKISKEKSTGNHFIVKLHKTEILNSNIQSIEIY